MTPHETLKQYLEDHNINYNLFKHKPVLTSDEANKVRPDYSLEQGAKALILRLKYSKGEKDFAMFVLPGDKKLDSKKLKEITECKDIRFATQEEIDKITGGILIGGIHPFGNLFGIELYVDETLLENDEIIFNAGDRSISIAINTQDYIDLTKPEILSFSLPPSS